MQADHLQKQSKTTKVDFHMGYFGTISVESNFTHRWDKRNVLSDILGGQTEQEPSMFSDLFFKDETRTQTSPCAVTSSHMHDPRPLYLLSTSQKSY